MKIAPAEKDFALRVKTGAANVVQGDSALVAVDVFRRNGFDGPVRVEVQGLPAGFVASEAIIPAGQNDGQLTLSAPADAATGLHTPQVLGKADVDGRPIRREGIPLETVGQAFYIKHMLPTEGFLLHVGKKALYTLSSDAPPGKELAIPRKGDLKIVVKAARLEGGKGQIVLGAAGLLPQGIVVRPAILFPGVNEATISVTAAPKAAADTAFNLVISGTMRIGPGTVTAHPAGHSRAGQRELAGVVSVSGAPANQASLTASSPAFSNAARTRPSSSRRPPRPAASIGYPPADGPP